MSGPGFQEAQLIGNILDDEAPHSSANGLNTGAQASGAATAGNTHLRASQPAVGRPNSAPPTVQLQDVRNPCLPFRDVDPPKSEVRRTQNGRLLASLQAPFFCDSAA